MRGKSVVSIRDVLKDVWKPKSQDPNPKTQPVKKSQNPKPKSQNPKPNQSKNPKTQNPKPKTQNPKPKTQNPKPKTQEILAEPANQTLIPRGAAAGAGKTPLPISRIGVLHIEPLINSEK